MTISVEAQQTEFSRNSIYPPSLSIIIPAYNEEKRIGPVLDDIADVIVRNELSWEIIVSIDGNDRTHEIVSEYSEKYPFILASKENRRSGKGSAIKRGLEHADGDFIILMDADNAIRFSSILSNIALVNNYDVINFDRYNSNSNRIPFIRKVVSRGYNILVRLILGIDINDTQCGYKIMRTDIAKKVFSKLTISNGFFYAPLFYYLKKEKSKTIEISIPYTHSDGSKFKVSSMILGGFVSTLLFRIRHSPVEKYIPDWFRSLYYRKFRWI